MGLFDTIRCEYPLPVAAHQDLEYQTKDLGSLLENYTITRDGRLIRHRRRGGLWGGRGPDRDIEWPIHGDIRMYDYDDVRKAMIEYVVRFTHGRVEWIRPFEKDLPLLDEEREVLPHEPPASRALVPELWGRRLTVDEYREHTPEKLELLDGEIPGTEQLLLVALTTLGLRRAAEIVGLERWKLPLEPEEPVESPTRRRRNITRTAAPPSGRRGRRGAPAPSTRRKRRPASARRRP